MEEKLDIYHDYQSWKIENHTLISNLVKTNSFTIKRFAPVIQVVDYLFDEKEKRELTNDEEFFFSTGFDYIFDCFESIKGILDTYFKGDIILYNKHQNTIALILYINDFKSEFKSLGISNYELKELDDLLKRAEEYLNSSSEAPDEFYQLLNDISYKIVEKHDIELHMIDEIFYQIAIEYDICKDDEIDIYNEVINKKIEERK